MSAPAFDQAAVWMAGRSRREQVLLIALGVLILVAVLWLAMVKPLLDARATAIGRIAAYEQVMVDVRTAGGVATPVARLSGPLQTALPAHAANFGLTPTISGDDRVAEVSLTGARYDALIPWLAALESSGTTLTSVQIRRGTVDGQVDATFSVQS